MRERWRSAGHGATGKTGAFSQLRLPLLSITGGRGFFLRNTEQTSSLCRSVTKRAAPADEIAARLGCRPRRLYDEREQIVAWTVDVLRADLYGMARYPREEMLDRFLRDFGGRFLPFENRNVEGSIA